jgi:3-methyladenine DNA glycosylase Tag
MAYDERPRCGWMGNDERMLRYHDEEWGVPVHDDRKTICYAFLQAGGIVNDHLVQCYRHKGVGSG